MNTTLDSALVWMRRDLRCVDHAALYHALRQARRVWCVFLFDTDLLDPLPRQDRRVAFIHDAVVQLDAALRELGGSAQHGLIALHGSAIDALPRLAAQLGVQAVFANHDDEPQALARDAQVRGRLSEVGAALYTSKDHVVFERNEVLTGNDTPYGVFTPYKNAWLKKLEPFYLQAYPITARAHHLAPIPPEPGLHGPAKRRIPTLDELGFTAPVTLKIASGERGGQALLDDFLARIDLYDEARDFPARKGPSYLGAHLRFGTLSIRHLAQLAWERAQAGSKGAEVWLSELIWRDFYHQVLHHHPHVIGHAYRREFDALKWVGGAKGKALFTAWCEGRTGYPLVDAGMRQLVQTGYMHNRLRMVTASFLIKDLGVDWRWGEAFFAEHLLDFDLAANNGGWQWSASTGCDASPWFRIFNPVTQSRKFDPEGRFIRRYVPELAALSDRDIHAPWLAPGPLPAGYPPPLVQHDEARAQTLARYGAVAQATPASVWPRQKR